MPLDYLSRYSYAAQPRIYDDEGAIDSAERAGRSQAYSDLGFVPPKGGVGDDEFYPLQRPKPTGPQPSSDPFKAPDYLALERTRNELRQQESLYGQRLKDFDATEGAALKWKPDTNANVLDRGLVGFGKDFVRPSEGLPFKIQEMVRTDPSNPDLVKMTRQMQLLQERRQRLADEATHVSDARRRFDQEIFVPARDALMGMNRPAPVVDQSVPDYLAPTEGPWADRIQQVQAARRAAGAAPLAPGSVGDRSAPWRPLGSPPNLLPDEVSDADQTGKLTPDQMLPDEVSDADMTGKPPVPPSNDHGQDVRDYLATIGETPIGKAIDTFGVPLPLVDAALTRGGRLGDIAANVGLGIGGSIVGGLAGGPFGVAGGGAAGSAAGDALAQLRQQIRGERENFSPVETGISAAAGAIPMGGPARVGGRVLNALATGARRAGQGAVIGSASEAARQALDERGQPWDLPRIEEAAGMGALLGGGMGTVEGGVIRPAAKVPPKLPPAAPGSTTPADVTPPVQPAAPGIGIDDALAAELGNFSETPPVTPSQTLIPESSAPKSAAESAAVFGGANMEQRPYSTLDEGGVFRTPERNAQESAQAVMEQDWREGAYRQNPLGTDPERYARELQQGINESNDAWNARIRDLEVEARRAGQADTFESALADAERMRQSPQGGSALRDYLSATGESNADLIAQRRTSENAAAATRASRAAGLEGELAAAERIRQSRAGAEALGSDLASQRASAPQPSGAEASAEIFRDTPQQRALRQSPAGGELLRQDLQAQASVDPARRAYIEPATQQPGTTYKYTVFRVGDPSIPDPIQVDVFDSQGRNVASSTPQELRALGVDIPDVPDHIPQGQYSVDEIRNSEPASVPDRMEDASQPLTTREVLEYAMDDRSHGDEAMAEAAKEMLQSVPVGERRNLSLADRQKLMTELTRRAKSIADKIEAVDIGPEGGAIRSGEISAQPVRSISTSETPPNAPNPLTLQEGAGVEPPRAAPRPDVPENGGQVRPGESPQANGGNRPVEPAPVQEGGAGLSGGGGEAANVRAEVAPDAKAEIFGEKYTRSSGVWSDSGGVKQSSVIGEILDRRAQPITMPKRADVSVATAHSPVDTPTGHYRAEDASIADLGERTASDKRGREYIPAVRDSSGRVFEGKSHPDATMEANRGGGNGKYVRGYVTKDGEFLNIMEIGRREMAKKSAADKLISGLESLKIHKPGQLSSGNPLTVAWDAAIDTAILGIRAGRKVAEVVQEAIAKFRQRHPEATEDDVARLSKSISSLAATREPSVSAPPTVEPPIRSLPETVRAANPDMPIPSEQYTPFSEKAQRKAADDFIAKHGQAEAERQVLDRQGDIAAGPNMRVLNRGISERNEAWRSAPAAEKQAALDRATGFISKVSKRATEGGRETQAWAEILRDPYSPDAMIAKAADSIEKKRAAIIGPKGEQAANDAVQAVNDINAKAADQVAAQPDLTSGVKLSKQSAEKVGAKLTKGDADLNKKVQQAMKDLNIKVRDIIRKHYTVGDAAAQKLSDKLVKDAGLTGAEADALAAKVQKRFADLTTEAKQKALANMQKEPSARKLLRKTVTDKLIEASNLGALSGGEQLLGAVAKDLKIPHLTVEQATKLQDMAERIQKLPEGFKRNEAIVDALSELRKIQGVGPMDIATSIYYAHILSGPTTQAVNGVSTAINTAMDLGTMAMTNPSKVSDILGGALEGLAEGRRQFARTMKTGVSDKGLTTKTGGAAGEGLKEFPVLEMMSRDPTANPVLRNYAKVLRYVGRAMSATDAVFYETAKGAHDYVAAAKLAEMAGGKGATRQQINKLVREHLATSPYDLESARTQAKTEGFNGKEADFRTAEIMRQRRAQRLGSEDEAGRQFALNATFNEKPRGLLGLVSNSVGDFANKFPPAKLFVPFTRIVANVANASMNYSPVGLGRAALGRSITQAAEKLGPLERQQLMIKGLAGTAGMAAGLAWAMNQGDTTKQPLLTGRGPSDANARNQLRETGWIPYSIKIGDRYYSYLNTPAALPAAIIGNLADKVHYDKLGTKSVGEGLASALTTVPETLTNMTFLQGLSQLAQIMKGGPEGESAVRQWAQGAAGSVVPNAVQQIDRAFDSKVRDTRSDLGSIAGRIPGIRESLPERLTVRGQSIQSNVTDRFTKASGDDDVAQFIAQNQTWIPGADRPTIGMGRDKRPATDDEYRDYQRMSGEMIDRQLQQMLPQLRRMPPEQAKKMVDGITSRARTNARIQLELRARAPGGSGR